MCRVLVSCANFEAILTTFSEVIRNRCFSFSRLRGLSSNISNTSDSVSSGYPNTEKIIENTTRSGVFLTKFEVWITDETLSRVFDISSQSKQNPRSKRRSKIVKIYAN